MIETKESKNERRIKNNQDNNQKDEVTKIERLDGAGIL